MSRHLPLTRPGLPVLRRGRSTVQLGLDPATAVVVDGLRDDAVTALLHLDGVTGRHQLVALAPELGSVLDELHERGLLDDDPGPSATLSRVRRSRQRADLAAVALARRSSAAAVAVLAHRARSTVLVRGNDTTTAQVAVGLAAAGVGTVALEGPDRAVTEADLTPVGPFEAGPSWRVEVSEAIRRQGAHPTVVTGRPRRAALAVVCAAADVDLPWTDPELADDLLADGVPHLAVAVSGAAARIGPFVLPGRGACLWCLDHRSTDTDPAWPAIADQLRHRHGRAAAACSVLTGLTAALAVTECLAHLDASSDGPSTYDAQLVVRVDHAVPQVVRLRSHPLCGCGWEGRDDTMAG